jgi:hypothetical protein
MIIAHGKNCRLTWPAFCRANIVKKNIPLFDVMAGLLRNLGLCGYFCRSKRLAYPDKNIKQEAGRLWQRAMPAIIAGKKNHQLLTL